MEKYIIGSQLLESITWIFSGIGCIAIPFLINKIKVKLHLHKIGSKNEHILSERAADTSNNDNYKNNDCKTVQQEILIFTKKEYVNNPESIFNYIYSQTVKTRARTLDLFRNYSFIWEVEIDNKINSEVIQFKYNNIEIISNLDSTCLDNLVKINHPYLNIIIIGYITMIQEYAIYVDIQTIICNDLLYRFYNDKVNRPQRANNIFSSIISFIKQYFN